MIDVSMLLFLFMATCAAGATLSVVLPDRMNLVMQTLVGDSRIRICARCERRNPAVRVLL